MAETHGDGVPTSTKEGDADGECGRPDTVDVLEGEHGVPWRRGKPRSSSANWHAGDAVPVPGMARAAAAMPAELSCSGSSAGEGAPWNEADTPAATMPWGTGDTGCGPLLKDGAGAVPDGKVRVRPEGAAAAAAAGLRRLPRAEGVIVLGTEKPACGRPFWWYGKAGGSTVSAAAKDGSLLRWEALGWGETVVAGSAKWGAGSGRCWTPLVIRSVLSMQKAREQTKLKKVSAIAAAAPAWACSAGLAPGGVVGAGME